MQQTQRTTKLRIVFYVVERPWFQKASGEAMSTGKVSENDSKAVLRSYFRVLYVSLGV